MKKILSYALFSATLLCAGVSENSYTKEEFEAIDNRSGEEIAKEYVDEIFQKLPQKIDVWTTLINATSINTKMYFTKTINTHNSKELKDMLSKEQGKKEYIKITYEIRKKEMCNNKKARNNMDKKNIGIQDDYYEANTKEYIGSYSIDKSDCVKLEQEQKSKGKYSLY